jgi:UDP-glucose 4-epimerase
MAKCLVTGGAGFIGSHLVDKLIFDGHEVIVIDDLSTGNFSNINKLATFNHDDISGSILKHTTPVDYVFHLAALARIQPSIKNPVPAHKTNVNGTLAVLEYCRKNKSKLIFSSTSSQYDEYPASELSIKDFKNPYTLQKHICEQYIELYSRLYNINYVILRYFNVYGERQLTKGAYATVIGIFLAQKKRKEPLTIVGDGEQRRDFTYIKDAVTATVMAKDWTGTYNVGTGINYSINEIAKMIGGKTKNIAPRLGEVKEVLADISKIKAKGWTPQIRIEQWLNLHLI